MLMARFHAAAPATPDTRRYELRAYKSAYSAMPRSAMRLRVAISCALLRLITPLLRCALVCAAGYALTMLYILFAAVIFC